jgi:glucose-6-phosphate 1-dehydrogenase
MTGPDRLENVSDALVLFGMTGDLAQKKIFPALYAMAKRNALTVPVVGVASSALTPVQLRHHIEQSIQQSCGIDDRPALERLLAATQYVSGNYNDLGTFAKLKQALGAAKRPAYYLAIPPSLFATVIKSLAASDLASGARVIVEKPLGETWRRRNSLTRSLVLFFPKMLFSGLITSWVKKRS